MAISTFRSVLTVLVAGAVFGPAVLAAPPADHKEAQAKILEQEKYPCENCFFGGTDYFFCFEADNQVLVAHDKIPTMNWTDPNKNYFGKLHGSWKNPAPENESLKISYDDRHVWMARADGKQIRLDREVSHDPFTNPQCRGAVKKAAGD